MKRRRSGAMPVPCGMCGGSGKSRLTGARCERCRGTGKDPHANR